MGQCEVEVSGPTLAPLGSSSSGDPAGDLLGSRVPVIADSGGPSEDARVGKEAVVARPALALYAPTRAEREAREATHLPFPQLVCGVRKRSS